MRFLVLLFGTALPLNHLYPPFINHDYAIMGEYSGQDGEAQVDLTGYSGPTIMFTCPRCARFLIEYH